MSKIYWKGSNTMINEKVKRVYKKSDTELLESLNSIITSKDIKIAKANRLINQLNSLLHMVLNNELRLTPIAEDQLKNGINNIKEYNND